MAALYYVVDYKLEIPRHWLIFASMIIIDQIMLITYNIVLVYLFHRNVTVSSQLYISLMLFPTFVLQLVSTIAGIVIKDDREQLIEAFGG